MSYINYIVCGLHYTIASLRTRRTKHIMKTPGIYYGAIAVFCIAAMVIGTAGAATMTQQGTGIDKIMQKGGHIGLEKILINLTAQGYDVSAISAAVTSGDYKTAHTLMQEFRTSHPDVFPVCSGESFRVHPGWQGRGKNNQ